MNTDKWSALFLEYHLIIVTKMLMIYVYLGVKFIKFQGENFQGECTTGF